MQGFLYIQDIYWPWVFDDTAYRGNDYILFWNRLSQNKRYNRNNPFRCWDDETSAWFASCTDDTYLIYLGFEILPRVHWTSCPWVLQSSYKNVHTYFLHLHTGFHHVNRLQSRRWSMVLHPIHLYSCTCGNLPTYHQFVWWEERFLDAEWDLHTTFPSTQD